MNPPKTTRTALPLAVAVALPVDDCCATDSCHTQAPAQVGDRDAGWHRAAATARALSWLSLVLMSGEGVLGLIAGVGAGSVSLVGWALGSVIEGLASIIVIWRFTGSRTLSPTAEASAQKTVAVSFFLLAPYLAIQSVRDLLTGHESTLSVLGVAVTGASLILMPAIGVAKQRLGARLDSGATAGEGVQNLLCAAQAGAVLIGLGLTGLLGWWWIDPAVGLILAAVAVREGRHAWGGDDCCEARTGEDERNSQVRAVRTGKQCPASGVSSDPGQRHDRGESGAGAGGPAEHEDRSQQRGPGQPGSWAQVWAPRSLPAGDQPRVHQAEDDRAGSQHAGQQHGVALNRGAGRPGGPSDGDEHRREPGHEEIHPGDHAAPALVFQVDPAQPR